MGTRETFQANLKHYRKKKGLSQEKLSEQLGFGTTYITEIESRRKFPKPETIDLIAAALGIEPYQLFVQGGAGAEEHQQEKVSLLAQKLYAHLSERLYESVLEEITDVFSN